MPPNPDTPPPGDEERWTPDEIERQADEIVREYGFNRFAGTAVRNLASAVSSHVEEAEDEVRRLREAMSEIAGDLAEARLHHEQGKWSPEAHRQGLERIEAKARALLTKTPSSSPHPE